MFLVGIPLLILPFVLYNMVVFLTAMEWSHPVVTIAMMSGTSWSLSASDILLSLSILLLFVEMMKATRMSTRTIVDHMLSMVLFIAMLIEFLLVKQTATSTFFLLLVISFVDVVGGFTITIRTAQRDVTVDTDRITQA